MQAFHKNGFFWLRVIASDGFTFVVLTGGKAVWFSKSSHTYKYVWMCIQNSGKVSFFLPPYSADIHIPWDL